MKRVDAYLSSLGYCSRRETRLFIRINEVLVNNKRVYDPSIKANHADILVNKEPLDSEKLLILLHKPKGYICSHNDAGQLIYSLLPERYTRRNPKISTIGRLDMDTTGAILLTDDGELNHVLSSPKKDVTKVYEAVLAEPLKGDEAEFFASGTVMLNGETKPLKAAKLEVLEAQKARLEIVEGKYHQVKRMFASTGNRVLELHRVSFDKYNIDDLKQGEFKLLDFN